MSVSKNCSQTTPTFYVGWWQLFYHSYHIALECTIKKLNVCNDICICKFRMKFKKCPNLHMIIKELEHEPINKLWNRTDKSTSVWNLNGTRQNPKLIRWNAFGHALPKLPVTYGRNLSISFQWKRRWDLLIGRPIRPRHTNHLCQLSKIHYGLFGAFQNRRLLKCLYLCHGGVEASFYVENG